MKTTIEVPQSAVDEATKRYIKELEKTIRSLKGKLQALEDLGFEKKKILETARSLRSFVSELQVEWGDFEWA